jgi:hypothetical protein
MGGTNDNEETRGLSIASYIYFIAAKFTLEVLGAAGAIWGSSEILHLRDPTTNHKSNTVMRQIAFVIGGIFLIRYYWDIQHIWYHQRTNYLPIKIHHRRRHMLPCFQIHASKFILNVLGGAGAIWGCAEAVSLRNTHNSMEWRLVAIIVGILFFIRWICQLLTYCLCLREATTGCCSCSNNSSSLLMTILRWNEALVVALILEVFGAVGACWGFSEIVTLRHPETNAFWQGWSTAFGLIFLLRWIIHLISFIKSEREMETKTVSTRQVQVDEDLELEETDSTEWEVNVMLETSKSTEENDLLKESTHPSSPQYYQKRKPYDQHEYIS